MDENNNADCMNQYIEEEWNLESISVLQTTSKALEVAVANEIEYTEPWIDVVSVTAAKPLIPPLEQITNSYVALPTGITSYVDLGFNYNVGSITDLDALLQMSNTGNNDFVDLDVNDLQVNQAEAEHLINELLLENTSNLPIVIEDSGAIDKSYNKTLQVSLN